jgi:membrane protease YdiL (CAAX protease family)
MLDGTVNDADEPRRGSDMSQGPPTAGPPAVPQPDPPQTPWGWRQVLGGSVMGFAPLLLLSLLASLSTTGPTSKTTAPTVSLAVALLIVTVVFDGWQLFAAWTFSLRRDRLPWSAWGFLRPKTAIVWAVPVALVVTYVVGTLYDAMANPPQQNVIDAFPHTTTGLILFALTACVVAPVFEEAFFRGFVFKGLARSWGPVWGAMVSSALFAAAHEQLTIFVPIFVLGLALCWVYQKTGSLWATIALHCLFNSIAVLTWAVT